MKSKSKYAPPAVHAKNSPFVYLLHNLFLSSSVMDDGNNSNKEENVDKMGCSRNDKHLLLIHFFTACIFD